MVEASSGSTAISEAYFARILRPTLRRRGAGDDLRREDRTDRILRRALPHSWTTRRRSTRSQLTSRLKGGGHYMDQFTYRRTGHRLARQQQHRRDDLRAAVRRSPPDPALDRGRLGHRRHRHHDRALHPLPGPRDATLRRRSRALRHLRLLPHRRRVADTGARLRRRGHRPRRGSSPRLSAASSTAWSRCRTRRPTRRCSSCTSCCGRRAGPSTGTNLCGAFELIAEMSRAGQQGSVVTLICDSGERYLQTYYNDVWMAQQKSICGSGGDSFSRVPRDRRLDGALPAARPSSPREASAARA